MVDMICKRASARCEPSGTALILIDARRNLKQVKPVRGQPFYAEQVKSVIGRLNSAVRCTGLQAGPTP